VVAVARRGDLTRAEVAADFDVSVESVNRWMRQADIDDGIRDGLTTGEQSELVQLRRKARRLEMENEILRRAAAYFAKDALPKMMFPLVRDLVAEVGTGCRRERLGRAWLVRVARAHRRSVGARCFVRLPG
jgi:transposase